MPSERHRHTRVKHIALRTVGVGATVAWRATGAMVRSPAKRTRVALIAEGEVLLIQNITNFRTWTLPGGGYHRGESALDCARRELREELGVDLPPQAFTATGEYSEQQHGTTYRYDTFIAAATRKPAITITWELVHAKWAPVGKLPSNVTPYVAKLLKKERQT